MKRIVIGMTLLLALALVTGCAAPAADNSALQAELDAVNKEMAALQAELEALKGSAPAQPEAPAAPAQAEAPAEPVRAEAEPAPVEAPAGGDPTPIPMENTDAPPADYTKTKADYDLDGLAAKTAAAVQQAENAERQADRDGNYTLYREIDKVLEEMDRELDRAEDQAERDYREGLLSRTDYTEIERTLEALEDDLDRAEDGLEYRLGVDD